ncbi:hypothetical protein PSHT_06015 [Puccinia striiformis]|uniref:FAD-binding FR-type domain-containing protein n=2 Tax=Puccinia striiformis TaxID=27350 RepID=A0A2S4W921_9BASI|nr:hypothetical protein PSHT_06015 [Puccinia striiformis]
MRLTRLSEMVNSTNLSGLLLRRFSRGLHSRASQQSSRIPSRKTSRWQRPSSAVFVGTGTLTIIAAYHYHYRSTIDNNDQLRVDKHTPYQITHSYLIAPDTAIINLDLPIPTKTVEPIQTPFYIESIYLKHPALQIERPYTPLSPISPSEPSQDDDQDRTTVELLVKRYDDGDMSTYIHHVIHHPHHNQLEIRGPVPTWWYPANQEIHELVFIAAGTGITPAIQLLRRIYKSSSTINQLPKFNLIYLTKSLESSYLLNELDHFKTNYPELFKFKLLVNHPTPSSTTQVNIDKSGRLDVSDLHKWIGTNDNNNKTKIIIVCGPESLICDVAGCKGRSNNSQGEIGGMLKPLGYTSDQVFKL